MKVGLISDTHSYLDPKVFDHFKDCDEVWHAGDIGVIDVALELERFKPFRAVHGNIDDREVSLRYPEDLHFTCEGLKVWMTHIGGAPPNYNPRISHKLKTQVPDIFICGHSHILRVKRDEKFGMLYINPGAAGREGFHHIRTIIRFEISGKEIGNMEVVELGKRGAL